MKGKMDMTSVKTRNYTIITTKKMPSPKIIKFQYYMVFDTIIYINTCIRNIIFARIQSLNKQSLQKNRPIPAFLSRRFYKPP